MGAICYDEQMVEAVIFDMDGLMVDSEPIRSLAFEAMIRNRGRKLPRLNQNGVVQTIGINVQDNCRRMQEEYGLEGSLDELVAEHETAYTRLFADRVAPMPGLLRLVVELEENGAKKAVASSSSHEHIGMVVNGLWAISPFQVVVSGTEVAQGKPAPDIFLRAAEKLGVAAHRCTVLEDAESGIRGAKAAGMMAIAVPSQFTLPATKQRAINRLGMGRALKYMLLFKTGELVRELFHMADGESTSLQTISNWWQSASNHKVLVGFAGGKRHDKIAAMDEGTLLSTVISDLESMIDRPIRDQLVDSWLVRWDTNPFIRGAYSNHPVGVGLDEHALLAEPVVNRLFFAGEATATSGKYATVHGAIESGQRAAKELSAR